MKKLLVVGVIVLFLGLACAPSINANVSKESELVEITTEICGLGGGKYTVQLTKEEAEEVDRIFENIRNKLNTTDSREETKKIFNDAVVELDKYELLGSFNIDDVRKILRISNNDKNSYLIYGKSTNTSNLERIGVFFYELSNRRSLGNILWRLYREIIWVPIHFGSWILFGTVIYDRYILDEKIPAEGHITIISFEGKEEYSGSFYGHLDFIYDFSFYDPDVSIFYCIGVKGFKGINLGNHYFGIAKDVYVRNNIPEPW